MCEWYISHDIQNDDKFRSYIFYRYLDFGEILDIKLRKSYEKSKMDYRLEMAMQNLKMAFSVTVLCFK